ncbi:hypothetical protein ALC53_07579 [Atta colombica]|uniref:Uncharacterized protein n=1 Tax=Atta colombica TaxID=520822 RepID=A0A195BBM2_9HYME|nr:hypothetical protein ALC53_07579 [Atta colombica]
MRYHSPFMMKSDKSPPSCELSTRSSYQGQSLIKTGTYLHDRDIPLGVQRENPLGRGAVRRRDGDFSLVKQHRARLEKRVSAADRRKTGSLSLLKIAFHMVKKFSFLTNPVQPLFTKRLHVVYYANVMHREWTSQDVNAGCGTAPQPFN